jgi:hypothetical protein
MTLYDEFQKETQHLRMSDAEKSAMRARLLAAMSGVPRRQRSPYQWMVAPRSFAVLGLAALLIISTGTAYAAEGSLPGAPLYPVKVHVMEPLAVALASGPAAKAQVHADLAVRRVQEAETLAAKGALTAQAAQEISDNYNVHAEAAIVLARDSDAAVGTSATATTSAEVAAAPATSTTPVQPQVAARATMTMLVASNEPTTTTQATTTAAKTSRKQHGLAGKLHAALSAEATILTNLNKKTNTATTSNSRIEKKETSGEQDHDEVIQDVTVPRLLQLGL